MTRKVMSYQAIEEPIINQCSGEAGYEYFVVSKMSELLSIVLLISYFEYKVKVFD